MSSWFWKAMAVVCVVGSFSALSSYSWAITYTPLRHVMEDRVKPVKIWRTRKAAVLAEVYGISPDELDEPIRIWGKQ